jgi:hypothetical protein
MKTRRLFAVCAAIAALGFGGCRNPFNPNAKLRFERWQVGPNSDYILILQQNTATTLANNATSLPDLITTALISNASTVAAKITGYNVVYRQLSTGNPIASCGGAAGRRFSMFAYISAMATNQYGESQLPFNVMLITNELLTHIGGDLTTTSGGIDCEVTFFGEDENGYDIQLDAVLHIDVL